MICCHDRADPERQKHTQPRVCSISRLKNTAEEKEKRMKQSISYQTIFGACVMNLYKKEQDKRSREQKNEAKNKEKELFEMIDDYVEQA